MVPSRLGIPHLFILLRCFFDAPSPRAVRGVEGRQLSKRIASHRLDVGRKSIMHFHWEPLFSSIPGRFIQCPCFQAGNMNFFF